ncbi:hypothetical protein FKW77_005885 [Venturia effusa]|uniref:PSP1 C-terminal domain-containing protein n=1 Tax=Venturia effusa TaxID=50376 RepID=A0A517KWG3_9PEZI|nr:hypothetical protein FKW77_005885 [Venturia effusa]
MTSSIAPKSANGPGPRVSMSSSAILEKKGMGSVRRSTPDSEALASSDDDHDQGHSMSMSLHSVKSLPSGPQRRPSWLTEVQASNVKQRKFSLGGTSYTSSGSQPTTPSGETGPWDSGANGVRPGIGGSASYPWNTQQWTTKDRPPRLTEVKRSPSGSFHEDLRSPTSNAGLPFEIPLEPSRKTIRSQSYSAGQLEKISGHESMAPNARYAGSKPGLAHRPSRPSMLGDGTRDTLGSLREDDDDVESSASSSDRGQRNISATARRGGVGRGYGVIPRAAVTSPQPNGPFRFGQRSTTFPLSPESDYAVADESEEHMDTELVHAMAQAVVSSNTSSATNLPSLAAIENRRVQGLKTSQWQTSLGFGLIEEGPQSRRHSFAELSRPRNNSMNVNQEQAQIAQYNSYNTSIASPLGQSESFQRTPGAEERKSNHFSTLSSSSEQLRANLVRMQHQEENCIIRAQKSDKIYAASYFAGIASHSRQVREPAPDDYSNPFAVPHVFSRPVRILYLVAFKCNRADIYYIPENTGLQVKAGDTVIVEGDRGQDLGTVEHGNIQMEQAKQFKEDYTQKHFRCLMMFSRMYPHIAAIAGDDAAFNGAVNGNQPNIGPTGGSAASTAAMNFSRDAAAQFEPEPRPKMIKRVARPDEVHLLREKEGNEAKAKRVCQTKVNEHGLRMEILDAEFQHDYRKLTFFYYAEEYINFNELVTDLFKVYKTRIWMSAINPASYTVMNPNNIVRPQHWPRPGPTTNAAAYLRAQEEYRTSVETGRTASPTDREGPAARGNREFERMVHMSNTPRTSAYPASMHSNGHSMDDYAAANTQYDPRRNNVPFNGGGQVGPFSHQFTPGAWPPSSASMMPPYPYPYPYPENRDAGNYSVAPSGNGHGSGLNQQAAAFTPRASHFSAGNIGYQNNGSAEQNMLMEQFQQLAINAHKSQEELPQVVVQTKTRQAKTALKRGLSTVEEEEEEDVLDNLHVKERLRSTKKVKSKAVKGTKFEAMVQSDRNELREYLKGLNIKTEDTDVQFIRQMKTFLTSMGIPYPGMKEQRQQDDFSAMHVKALRLVQASKRLDTDFSAMVATAESAQRDLKKEDAMNTFQHDKKAAAQLLEKGMGLSMKRIDQLLPEGAKAGKQASSTDTSSDLPYTEASAYFQNTHPEENRLRATLVQTAKGVKRFVRFLPEEDS